MKQGDCCAGETVLAILFSYVSVCTKDLCLGSRGRAWRAIGWHGWQTNDYHRSLVTMLLFSAIFYIKQILCLEQLGSRRLVVVQQFHPAHAHGATTAPCHVRPIWPMSPVFLPPILAYLDCFKYIQLNPCNLARWNLLKAPIVSSGVLAYETTMKIG
jgi:hypothetical protein